ncbi:hypothetical protein [Phenylobacterium sp. SCN 70-31]|uniref:hypothetical protein n=1 Tax=Phenylobacterium sp. SCN 70-31 TaxID=1660129 RepID=UPI0025DDFE0C|nr:hypothetical protein [Phenylobacterium sp. SCN 70-31]
MNSEITYETLTLTLLQEMLTDAIKELAWSPEQLTIRVYDEIVWPLLRRIIECEKRGAA